MRLLWPSRDECDKIFTHALTQSHTQISHIHKDVHTQGCTYTPIHTHTQSLTYMRTKHTHTHTHDCSYTLSCLVAHTYIESRTHTHTQISQIHKNVHTHTDTHTHIG